MNFKKSVISVIILTITFILTNLMVLVPLASANQIIEFRVQVEFKGDGWNTSPSVSQEDLGVKPEVREGPGGLGDETNANPVESKELVDDSSSGKTEGENSGDDSNRISCCKKFDPRNPNCTQVSCCRHHQGDCSCKPAPPGGDPCRLFSPKLPTDIEFNISIDL